MKIAIVLYPGFTALDAIGPYEVLKMLPGAELRFVAHAPAPVSTDRGILVVGATHSFAETPDTTSVCSGAVILAASGLLKGQPATTHWAAMDVVKRFGATPCTNERIVRAGKIWTAAGVSAGIDLAFALAEEIAGRETAERIQLMLEYDPQPPQDAGHMDKAAAAIAAAARTEMAHLSRNPMNAVAVGKIVWRQALAMARTSIGNRNVAR